MGARVKLWSTNRSFVLQSVDNCPGLRTDYPIDGDLESLLQILDPRLGLGSVASIDTTDVKSHETHPLLRTTDWKASRANAQNGLALIGLVEPTREAALRQELPERGCRVEE